MHPFSCLGFNTAETTAVDDDPVVIFQPRRFTPEHDLEGWDRKDATTNR